MPALVQICIVIATIGLLGIALLTLRVISRFLDKTASDMSQLTLAARETLTQVDLTAQDARSVVASIRDCVPPVKRVVERFESVGQRTAELSSVVLGELALPVFTAAAVARGVNAGAHHLLKSLIGRLTHRHSPSNGE